MLIPEIDLAHFQPNNSQRSNEIPRIVSDALRKFGFMSVVNLGIEPSLVEEVFSSSRSFFCQEPSFKRNYAYSSSEENFGYQWVGSESLNPGRPPDLKETFTMRNPLNYQQTPSRWPSSDFQSIMTRFFEVCMEQAHRIERLIALSLDIEADFFSSRHGGENISLRLLRYPAYKSSKVLENQLGAGEHRDYGLITLLFQDGLEGLQIRNAQSNWISVPSNKSNVIVNSGDMLERWSNGWYQSTAHRVIANTNSAPRYSIAFFVDPDSDVQIDVLANCTDSARPKKYKPIKAGEYIKARLDASHKDNID